MFSALLVNKPRWLSAFWFAGFRLLWSAYWFGMVSHNGAMAGFSSTIAPIAASVIMAGIVGFYFGYRIVLMDRTRSCWMAALKGIVVQHMTTILYLPFATMMMSMVDGKPFLMSLYFSYIISLLAGLPIHTIIGSITGTLLYFIGKRQQATA